MSKLQDVYNKSNNVPSGNAVIGGGSKLQQLFQRSNPNGVKPPPPAPPEPAPVVPPKKPGLLSRATSAVSKFLAESTEAPTYTTGSKTEIARNLPGEIMRTILPGAAAAQDNPELTAQTTNLDVLKELPKATAQTGFDILGKPLITPILTGYGATSNLIKKVSGGKFQAPGVGEKGAVNVDTPFGPLKNVQQKALETPYENIKTPTGFIATAAKLTGFELLDWL